MCVTSKNEKPCVFIFWVICPLISLTQKTKRARVFSLAQDTLNWLASYAFIFGHQWQNPNFGDKTVLENLFRCIVVYMWSFDAWSQESNNKSLTFGTREIFMPDWKFADFWKLTSDFENRHKHRFKTTAGAMEDQSTYSHVLEDWFRPVFKTKKLSFLHTSGFSAQM